MARHLHILGAVLGSLGSGTAMLILTGCVVPPPIEPEAPEENFPPFIDDVEPATRTTQVTTSAPLVLSARLFDPNAEQSLSVAWIGEKTGFIKTGRFRIEPTEELDRGIFYEFGQTSHELSTCTSVLRFEDQETIWVYVSDGQLDFPSPNTIESEGGFIESHSWLLELDPNRCDGSEGL